MKPRMIASMILPMIPPMIPKIIAIIGDPIHHSLSPVMQNAVFQKMKLPYIYLPFRIPPGQLKSFLRKAREWKITGFNVTIPHKESILPSLDWISPEAKAIGAVNTVLVRQGKLYGYNTDAEGYLLSLKEEVGFDPCQKKIFILGAGGAARAILYALSLSGAHTISICNRTSSKALRLAKEFSKNFKSCHFDVVPFDKKNLAKHFPNIDLLINATSLGLSSARPMSSLPLERLSPRALVSDLIYRPYLTPLLRRANRLKLRTLPGFGMLLYQGAQAFKIWTHQKPDLRVMRKALLDALK